jgi:hypothetical protein
MQPRTYNHLPFVLFTIALLPYAVVVGAGVQIWAYTSESPFNSVFNSGNIWSDFLAIIISMIVSQFFMVCGLVALSLSGKQK